MSYKPVNSGKDRNGADVRIGDRVEYSRGLHRGRGYGRVISILYRKQKIIDLKNPSFDLPEAWRITIETDEGHTEKYNQDVRKL